ncbi:uncharacterized protein Z520_08571 [Fonsecaea multimorphosa CBS 102226]|uniref:Glycosyl transferase CAP10 domain-containing protein n=1 Tax=Fonsecaea multimorphosa CBS 102226 TaxID=1442371 RepID=A0A0D2KGS7_9EURO|nr:uncharacterized protein Z520_08571 [Fonsecaea multimorphosa CBS 102226]KIX95863.1 hypothetical protein Z520_08571 [Fonsecaea multimorphosa CBS 102226]OAL21599.1 hypothetical protein AYO22_07995 [Fonsecaea multimorphosa]
MASSQSKTIEEAVVTYKKRFNRDPPPDFDKWFELAQKNHYSLVDEFDTIMESLEPFWGIDPPLMRRAIESVPDTASGVVRISIKNHQIEEKATHRGIYHANIIDRWLEKPGWLDVLPDMTILVNRYDEPRVVASSEALLAAREAAMSTSATRKPPREAAELSWFDCARRGLRHTILSACPANSPSRDETIEKMAPIKQEDRALPFVHSLKESQDVCNNPTIHRSHGFFTSPTSCSITESLYPVFSPCKPSIFNDILYPPIWYWLKLIQDDYDEDDDMEWSEKKDLVYWTGSATGGWATLGNWRTLHRQSLVLQTMSQNTSVTILQRGSAEEDVWQPQTTPMSNLSHLFDLRITSIPPEQCESSACDAMRHAFLKRDPTYVDPPREEEGTNKSGGGGSGGKRRKNPNADPLSTAYGAKYVLDMDGNAFSGRFYRLLLSKSAVLKQTVFQEWHDGRLVPWVHFIPISPGAEELAEVVRYLSEDERGKEIRERIARQGRDWAQKTLRMVDLELTMLRVLMEYGRLVSDHRQEMGFTL